MEGKWREYDASNLRATDGEGIIIPSLGDKTTMYNRLFVFTRGGVLVGNPDGGENFEYVRLLDFFTF